MESIENSLVHLQKEEREAEPEKGLVREHGKTLPRLSSLEAAEQRQFQEDLEASPFRRTDF